MDIMYKPVISKVSITIGTLINSVTYTIIPGLVFCYFVCVGGYVIDGESIF